MSIHAQGSSEESKKFVELRKQAKKANNERPPNKARAIELQLDALEELSNLKERRILDEEATRFDLAQLNLDRADLMKDREQIATFANEAIKRWLEYLEWYKKLGDEDLKLIKANPNSDRIQQVVQLLGNAYMRRENIPPNTIRELFSSYLALPVEYCNSNSIELWQKWLFRCPKWEVVANPSLRELKPKLAAKDAGESCRADWVDFKNFLAEWLEKQTLAPNKKGSFQRQLADLSSALNEKKTQETNH